MYNWRTMTDEQRDEILVLRQGMRLPWHSPPCEKDTNWYHLSAANFEHKTIIGLTPERMLEFEEGLLQKIAPLCIQISAWCILPNHYHLLLQTCDIQALRKCLGHLHSRTAFQWNNEDGCTGRKCWHRCLPKKVKSHRHRMATMNYIHNNPVHHNCVECWQQWPFSSALQFLEYLGREQAVRIWKEYPIGWIGEHWDNPEF